MLRVFQLIALIILITINFFPIIVISYDICSSGFFNEKPRWIIPIAEFFKHGEYATFNYIEMIISLITALGFTHLSLRQVERSATIFKWIVFSYVLLIVVLGFGDKFILLTRSEIAKEFIIEKNRPLYDSLIPNINIFIKDSVALMSMMLGINIFSQKSGVKDA